MRIILYAVEAIIKEDISNKNYKTVIPLPVDRTDPDVIITRIFQNPIGSGRDYIVTINDNHDDSSLSGSPYVFQFAVRNRKPRFDHLPDLNFIEDDLDADGKVTRDKITDKLTEDSPRCSDNDDDRPEYVSCVCDSIRSTPDPIGSDLFTPPINILCISRDGKPAHTITRTISIGVTI